MITLELKNSSQQKIIAHLFSLEISKQKLVLINSATGVKQQIYFKIAEYLAENGFTVITYDYSGIGLSKPKNLRNYKSSMRTWGTEDYKTITDFIKLNYQNYEKHLIGHSVGALILGMNKDSDIFKSFVFFGTQKAYVGHLNLKTKLTAYGGFGIIQPLTTRIFGYFPAHRFGLGESLPKHAANDWKTLVMNKNSTNALLEKLEENFSKNLTQNVLVLRAEDDNWLTETGVKNLLTETYPNLKPIYSLIKTEESPKNEIGHVNFFRSYNEPLWSIILQYFHM